MLSELTKVPSDNPPGDCLAHAERAASLLQDLWFVVEQHSVLEDLVRKRDIVRVVNLLVREQFGPGPLIALNSHGDVVPPVAGWMSILMVQ
jgi:acetylornithine deacetylase/succinyl-diaminopimelate desuccinylase-like protein